MPMGALEFDVFTEWRHCVRHHGYSVIKKQYRKRERQWINLFLRRTTRISEAPPNRRLGRERSSQL